MAEVRARKADHDLIPPPRERQGSRDGAVSWFEVVTARVTDADSVQGRDADLIKAIWKDIWRWGLMKAKRAQMQLWRLLGDDRAGCRVTSRTSDALGLSTRP